MKKIFLNKSLRIAFICIFLILVIILVFFMYKEVNNYQEKNISLYSYNNKADINYSVLLKPNIIYEEKSLGEDGIYITPYTDIIKSTFKYEFEGEKEADIKGDYEVLAVVEGYNIVEKKVKTIWKKTFIIKPKTSFEVKDKEVALAQDISIGIDKYNSFVSKVIEDSKVQSSVKLSVIMNINLKANNDKGLIEEKMSPSIVLPLNTNYFEIIKNIPEEKKGAIEETQQVKIPVNKNRVIIYSTIMGLILIMLIYLLFFTVGFVKDQFTKQLDKIFKKHGNRLVALNSEVSITSEIIKTVRTFDDLVRVADEIGKPILYKYSSTPQEITNFYISDENNIYIFDLKKAVETFEVQKQDKKFKKINKAVEKNKDDIHG